MSNLKRIQNEIKLINSNEYNQLFSIEIMENNIFNWKIKLFGPILSPYQNKIFDLDLLLPDNYPFEPPTIKFITHINHINVNSNGDICLDILNDKWSPAQNIKTLLLSIHLLLSNPNYDDPFNFELAELFRNNKDEYLKLLNN